MSEKEAASVLGVRMDEELKRDFMAAGKELGLSASAIVNALAKALLRERRVPFEMDLNTERPAARPAEPAPEGPEAAAFARLRARVIGDAKTFGIDEVNGVIRYGFDSGRFEHTEAVFTLDWEDERSLSLEVSRSRPEGKSAETWTAFGSGGGMGFFRAADGSAPEPAEFGEFSLAVGGILSAIEFREAQEAFERMESLSGAAGLSGSALPEKNGEQGAGALRETGRDVGDGCRFALEAGGRRFVFGRRVLLDCGEEHNLLRVSEPAPVPGGEAPASRTYAAGIDYSSPSGTCGGYGFTLSESGPDGDGRAEEVSHHVFFRALLEALDMAEAEARRRAGVFDRSMDLAAGLFGSAPGTEDIRPEKGKAPDGKAAEALSLACLTEGGGLSSVRLFKSHDLEWMRVERFSCSGAFEDGDGASVLAGWKPETAPLLAVKRFDDGTGLWDTGFFELGECSGPERLPAGRLGSFPEWGLDGASRPDAEDILSSSGGRRISPDDFFCRTGIFTGILEDDMESAGAETAPGRELPRLALELADRLLKNGAED